MGESCRRYDARVLGDVSITIGTQPGRGNVERDVTYEIGTIPSRFARPPDEGVRGYTFSFKATSRYLGDSSSVSTSKGCRWKVCRAAADIEAIGSLPQGPRAVNCWTLAAGNSNKAASFAVNS
jgi:hypothetical protein